MLLEKCLNAFSGRMFGEVFKLNQLAAMARSHFKRRTYSKYIVFDIKFRLIKMTTVVVFIWSPIENTTK